MHICSAYCMRKRRKRGGTKPRFCRAGAGDEATPNKNDTPGFKLRNEPAITKDEKNFLKLEMPRNNLRLHQTPIHVLRGWRGNCDIKILFYESSSENPDLEEIAQVTDYVVAYTCKGTETIKIERDILKDFILK